MERFKNPIYTINTRDGIVNSLLNFKESSEGINLGITFDSIVEELKMEFNNLLDSMDKQNLDYKKFRNSLIPHRRDREYIFLFDRFAIEEVNYGNVILSILLKLMKNMSTAITRGDVLEDDKLTRHYVLSLLSQDLEYSEKVMELDAKKVYYIIYLNNITKKQAKDIHNDLVKYNYYVGYKGVHNDNDLKVYLYINYINDILKIENNLFMLKPYDIDDSEIIQKGNVLGIPIFDNIEYFNVQEYYYDAFLVFTPDVDIYGVSQWANTSIAKSILFGEKTINIDVSISEDKYNYLTKGSEHNIEIDKNILKKIVESKARYLDFYELKKEFLNDNENKFYYSFMMIINHDNKKYKCIINYKCGCFEINTMYETSK